MNMEGSMGQSSTNEGEEKQANFEQNAARAAEIQKEITEAVASRDFAKVGELSQEGQRLKTENENVVAEDQQEAMEMNAEFGAEKARREAETKQREAEEIAARTEQARLDAEQAAADQAAAEKLAAEIKEGSESVGGEAPERSEEPSAFDKTIAKINETNAIMKTKGEERLRRIEETVARSPEKSPAERLKRYLEDNGNEFYDFTPAELDRAIQDMRRAQGVEDFQRFEGLPDGQFVQNNGSVLIKSEDKYYWTRNQSRVDEIRALGFKDGDSGIGVPFSNAALDDFKWDGMKKAAGAVEDTINGWRKQAEYEIRNKQA